MKCTGGSCDAFSEIFHENSDLRHFYSKENRLLRKSMETRNRLREIAAKSPEMWSAYSRQRHRVTKEVRHSIRDYYEGLIEKNKGDPKNMWKTINRVLDRDINLRS